MAHTEEISKSNHAPALAVTPRQPYAPPTLITYGSVTALTAGGTPNQQESAVAKGRYG